jgi:hypothetical protein
MISRKLFRRLERLEAQVLASEPFVIVIKFISPEDRSVVKTLQFGSQPVHNAQDIAANLQSTLAAAGEGRITPGEAKG